jgi:hypothetical protein
MLKLMCVISILLLTFPAFCQSGSDYQVATIIDVKPHQPAADGDENATRYDVAVKVGDTIYQVLYTAPLGVTTVKYAAGRNLLVLVGKKTITYNDILGRATEVPILSQKPATEKAKRSK